MTGQSPLLPLASQYVYYYHYCYYSQILRRMYHMVQGSSTSDALEPARQPSLVSPNIQTTSRQQILTAGTQAPNGHPFTGVQGMSLFSSMSPRHHNHRQLAQQTIHRTRPAPAHILWAWSLSDE